MFCCSFYKRRSQKHKKDSQVVSLFEISGSACIKAARRTLMMLTPDPKSAKIQSSRQSFLRFASVKAASKMLLKSTPPINCV